MKIKHELTCVVGRLAALRIDFPTLTTDEIAAHLEQTANLLCEVRDAVHHLEATIARSPWDTAPCTYCGENVLCLPDGVSNICEPCAKKEMAENA